MSEVIVKMGVTDDFFKHYGVKGMEWGKKKKQFFESVDKTLRKPGEENLDYKHLMNELLKPQSAEEFQKNFQDLKDAGEITLRARDLMRRQQNGEDISADLKALTDELSNEDLDKEHQARIQQARLDFSSVTEKLDIVKKALKKETFKEKLIPDFISKKSNLKVDSLKKEIESLEKEYSDKLKQIDIVSQDKPRLSEIRKRNKLKHSDVLQHFGILGMKWGVLTGGNDGKGPGADGSQKLGKYKKNPEIVKAKATLSDTDALENIDTKKLNDLANRIDAINKLNSQVNKYETENQTVMERGRAFVAAQAKHLLGMAVKKGSEIAFNKFMQQIENKYNPNPFEGLKNMPMDQLKEEVARMGLEKQFIELSKKVKR